MSSATSGVNAPLLQENKPPGKHASVSGAVFNASTSIIGAGIMSISATLKVLGVVPAFLLIVVIAWLADVSVEFLMRYTHAGNSSTFAGVMKESVGQVGSVLVQICVMINNLGCLIIYLIIIGIFSLRKLQQSIMFLNEENGWFMVSKCCHKLFKWSNLALQIMGDVLSGNQPERSVHLGVLEEWFGIHWWNSRAFAMLFIVVFIKIPLVLFRRVGQFFSKRHSFFVYSS
ncbi:hypothetical protein CRYUN_Cryun01aG0024000 [Craigia yunnanensis]